MDSKYIKDFAIGLTLIMIFVFVLKDVSLFTKTNKVSEESEYTQLSVNQSLMSKIHEIEASISDRKQFVFTVTKDPLERDIIVKNKMDLLEQWTRMVQNMVRLAGTAIDENGATYANIAYQGKIGVYRVGDYVAGRLITNISNQQVTYVMNGQRGVMNLAPIPPKPAEIKEEPGATSDLNW